MDKSPLVTIGIPVFNAEKYIGFSIQSVLNQTFTDFELIITDDGSTDNSVSIIMSFIDPRIRLVTDQMNKGISYRLNQQIMLARGRYFVRMDADDIMFTNRIEKQTQYLIDNPETDVIGAHVVVINEVNQVVGYRNWPAVFTGKSILRKNLFIHPTVAGKIDWFRSNHYNSKFDGAEDYHLWVSSFELSRFEVISEPVMFYRELSVFKIWTYISRLNKSSNAVSDFRKQKIIGSLKWLQLKSINHIKLIINVLFYISGISRFLIARRNRRISSLERDHYNHRLRDAIA